RSARCSHEERIVDEARIVFVVERRTKCERLPERHVERESAFRAVAIAFRKRITRRSQLERSRIELRSPWNVPNRAAERSCAVERALRSEEDFDALDILQGQVDVQRNLAHVGRDRTAAVIADGLARGDGVRVEAAHDDLIRASTALIADIETWNGLG